MQIIFLPSLSRQVSGSSKLTMMLEGKLRLNEVLMMLTLKAFLNFLVISKKRFKTVMELFSDGIHKTTRKSHVRVEAAEISEGRLEIICLTSITYTFLTSSMCTTG